MNPLAEEQFERALFDHYMGYMRRMDPEATKNREPRTGGSRGIMDILKASPPPGTPPKEIVEIIKGFRSVEHLLPDYSRMITALIRNSPARLRFNMSWTGEEALHGWALDEYLLACGASTMDDIRRDHEAIMAVEWNPVPVNENFADPWYGATAYVTIQEKITSEGYRWLGQIAEACGQVALAKICYRLAADEARHHAFYAKIAEMARSFDQERFDRTFILAVREFAMPGKYAPGLPGYAEWSKTGMRIGVVPDPRFAIPVVSRQKRGALLGKDQAKTEEIRISCWNRYVEAILGIFRRLKLEVPETLRILTPITVPA